MLLIFQFPPSYHKKGVSSPPLDKGGAAPRPSPQSTLLRFTLCFGILAAIFFTSSLAHAWRHGPWRFSLQLRFSSGWDDNVRRLALPPEPENFPDWKRLGGGLPIQSRLPPVSIHSDGVHQASLLFRSIFRKGKHFWRSQYAIGGKHFFWTSDEDTLIQKLNNTYYLRLHRRLYLGAEIQAIDRRRINRSREYSVLHGKAMLLFRGPSRFQISLSAGYNLFDYRHFEDFNEAHVDGFSDGQRYSNHGDGYQIFIKKGWNRHFQTHVSYGFSRSFYQIRRSLDADKKCTVTRIERREDQRHQASVGFRFLYVVLLKGGYYMSHVTSDSCGDGFTGHRFWMSFAFQAFWKIYVVAQGQLLLRYFPKGATLSPSESREDDNLSSITIRLSRPLWKNLFINLRYSHYANLLGLGINQYSRNFFTVGFSLLF